MRLLTLKISHVIFMHMHHIFAKPLISRGTSIIAENALGSIEKVSRFTQGMDACNSLDTSSQGMLLFSYEEQHS